MSAVVVGGTSGIGEAVARRLAGSELTVVGRDADRVAAVAGELGAHGLVGDASDEAVAARILERAPDSLVLALGARPRMAPVDEQDWASFSAPWNTDVKATFLLGQGALRRPLRPGSKVVVLSSGAAIGGSPLSGGYAGSKRTQWFLVSYLRQRSEALQRGIRFHALLPRQLVVGTEVGEIAAAAYGGAGGRDAFLARWPVPLTPDRVADALIALLAEEHAGQAAFTVDGAGLAPIS